MKEVANGPAVRLPALIAMVLIAVAGNAHAIDLATATTAAIARYNALADPDLPVPTAVELDALVGGEVLEFRRRESMRDSAGETDDHIRMIGMVIVERPRLLTWLAALDVGTQHAQRLTEHRIEGDETGGSLWYQHMDFTWPVRDRHWVIRNSKSVELALGMGGKAWEHAWELEDGGDTVARRLLDNGEIEGLNAATTKRAIYLPINRGAWTMFELDERHTLVAAHVSTVLGGWIPDSWVSNFVARHFKAILGGLAGRSDVIHEAYNSSVPVYTGEGKIVTPEMARKAAQ